MELEQVYYLTEIIGVVAVIASLIFVGVQMNQNTRAMEVSTSNAAMQNWLTVGRDVPLNSELADIVYKASQVRGKEGSIAPLTDEEFARLLWWNMVSLKTAEVQRHQWTKGYLDEDLWVGAVGGLKGFLRQPLAERLWDLNRMAFGPNFVAFVDELIEEIRVEELN